MNLDTLRHLFRTSETVPLDAIRLAFLEGQYRLRVHARQRLAQRGVSLNQIRQIIEHGEVLEVHPDAEPWPKCLLLGFLDADTPLYVSVAYDGVRVYIITAHWMNPEWWLDPRTRRTV